MDLLFSKEHHYYVIENKEDEKKDYSISITVNATAQEAFKAINSVSR